MARPRRKHFRLPQETRKREEIRNEIVDDLLRVVGIQDEEDRLWTRVLDALIAEVPEPPGIGVARARRRADEEFETHLQHVGDLYDLLLGSGPDGKRLYDEELLEGLPEDLLRLKRRLSLFHHVTRGQILFESWHREPPLPVGPIDWQQGAIANLLYEGSASNWSAIAFVVVAHERGIPWINMSQVRQKAHALRQARSAYLRKSGSKHARTGPR